jgi:hypothetical protein
MKERLKEVEESIRHHQSQGVEIPKALQEEERYLRRVIEELREMT